MSELEETAGWEVPLEDTVYTGKKKIAFCLGQAQGFLEQVKELLEEDAAPHETQALIHNVMRVVDRLGFRYVQMAQGFEPEEKTVYRGAQDLHPPIDEEPSAPKLVLPPHAAKNEGKKCQHGTPKTLFCIACNRRNGFKN